MFPRDEGAADAAATMAGTEQGGKAVEHGELHVGFECPISHEAGQDRPVCTRRVQEQLRIPSLLIAKRGIRQTSCHSA